MPTDVIDDTALIEAYNRFMLAKWNKLPDPPRFAYFDPFDDKPDWNQGLVFIEVPRDYILKHNRGWIESLQVARKASKVPPKVGIYLDIGTSWLYIAAGPLEAIDFFNSLAVEFAPK